MKKWMAIILAAACLCSMLVGGTLFVGAETTGRDWTAELDDMVWHQSFGHFVGRDMDTLDLWGVITRWTLMNYEECTEEGTGYVCGNWDGKTFTANSTECWTVKVPADKFDEYVKKCTQYKGDYRQAVIAFQEKRTEREPDYMADGELLYIESMNAYLIDDIDRKGGCDERIFRMGYTQNDDATYTVYYQGGEILWLEREWGDRHEYNTLEQYDSITDNYNVSWHDDCEYVRYSIDEFKEMLKANRSYIEKTYININAKDYPLYAWRAGDYCKVTVRENDGCVQILGMEATDRLPDDMIETANHPRERKITYELCEGVRVDGGKAFPEGATVRVAPVEDPNTLTAVNQALVSVAAGDNTAVYAIEALLDGQPLQPFGGVTVTFSLPSSWTAEGLKLYYVADDGNTEAIPVTVDPTAKTVTATLTHFSTYALCHTAAAGGAGSSDGSTGGAADRTPAVPTGVSDRVTAVCGAVVLLSLAALAAVMAGKKRQAQ